MDAKSFGSFVAEAEEETQKEIDSLINK